MAEKNEQMAEHKIMNLLDEGIFGHVTSHVAGNMKNTQNNSLFSTDALALGYFPMETGGQVTTLPIQIEDEKTEIVSKICQETVTKKGIWPFTKTTTETIDRVVESKEQKIIPYKTSELLKNYDKDEPLHIAMWGLPSARASSRNEWRIYMLLMGESYAPLVEKLIRENPTILRDTCKKVFPDFYNIIERYNNLNSIKHRLLEGHRYSKGSIHSGNYESNYTLIKRLTVKSK